MRWIPINAHVWGENMRMHEKKPHAHRKSTLVHVFMHIYSWFFLLVWANFFTKLHESFCILPRKGRVQRIGKNIFKKVSQKVGNFCLLLAMIFNVKYLFSFLKLCKVTKNYIYPQLMFGSLWNLILKLIRWQWNTKKILWRYLHKCARTSWFCVHAFFLRIKIWPLVKEIFHFLWPCRILKMKKKLNITSKIIAKSSKIVLIFWDTFLNMCLIILRTLPWKDTGRIEAILWKN